MVITLIIGLITFLLARIFGHTLHIGGIGWLRLSDLKYSNRSLTISSKTVQFTFYLPRLSNPRWGTFTVLDYEYKDAQCHVTISKLNATMWIFPFLLRFTAGPLISVELADFRVLVYSSEFTPDFIQRLRRNLIYTILNAETIRLDDFQTQVTFSTKAPINDGRELDGPIATSKDPGPEEKEGLDDESRVTVSTYQWHIFNQFGGRMYTFGNIDAQLRRSWLEDLGSFIMIAKECRWTKVPSLTQHETYRNWRDQLQFLHAIIYFPVNLVKALYSPLSVIDIYVPRTDITFQRFRIRDAELPQQAGAMLKKNVDDARRSGALDGFTWDTFARFLIGIAS